MLTLPLAFLLKRFSFNLPPNCRLHHVTMPKLPLVMSSVTIHYLCQKSALFLHFQRPNMFEDVFSTINIVTASADIGQFLI